MFADTSVLDWISTHIALVGFPTLCAVVWQFRGTVDRFLKKMDESIEATRKTHALAAETKAAVDLIQGNHLSHVQKSIDDLGYKMDDKNRQDAVERTETLRLLGSIDKSLAIISARQTRD